MTRVVIAGGGVAGLSLALLLDRAGLSVDLVERDAAEPPADPDRVLTSWHRPGLPQLGHSHTHAALGYQVLRRRLPDVLERILRLGGRTVELGMLPAIPERLRDPEIVVLLTRRAVIDWALREAVGDSDVRLITGCRVTRLHTAADDPRGIAGVTLSDGRHLEATWVVDATGRTSKLPRWLRDLGIDPAADQEQPCGVAYYGRHFRLRPGRPAPAGQWILGPSGDLGFLRYSVLPEDGGAYVVSINPGSGDRELRGLHDERAWHAAADALPAVRGWADPEAAEPLSPVLAMGGLINRLRVPYREVSETVAGLLWIGDALCHTDPTQGWGVSLALDHADRVSTALARGNDRMAVTRNLVRELTDAVRPYYTAAAGEDRERLALAAGEPVNWLDPNSALFCRKVLFPAAGADPALLIAVHRRTHLLDPPAAIWQHVGRVPIQSQPGATDRQTDRGALVSAIARATIGDA